MGFIKYSIIAGKAIGNSPNMKGNFGEMIVKSIFDSRFFGSEKVYIINDIYFETRDGTTHQIDHIVIYKNGIYCIETKNMKGKIYGKTNSTYWTQYSGSGKYQFYNPILQNETHARVINEYLGNRYTIYPVIVFINKNKPINMPEYILNIDELREYIKNNQSAYELTNEEMDELNFILLEHQKEYSRKRNQHIRNVINNH